MNTWVNVKRVARYGLIGFIRNGFVSLAAIVIMAITLFVVAGLLMAGSALESTLTYLTEKVDVNVYFVTNATEQHILDMKRQLESLPEVASVAYTNREQAIAEFRERHKNDQLILQGLDELADNPLGASLSVRAKETSQYESIAKFLESTEGLGGAGAFIEKVNFHQNKTAIDRLSSIIGASRQIGIASASVFIIATILIAFNTVRLAIYTAREEIGVMNIVGASPWYVRGPFVIAGVLYGVISALVVLVILYPLTYSLSGPSADFFPAFDVFEHYTNQFPFYFLVLVGSGICLGAVSSMLAIRRYLHT